MPEVARTVSAPAGPVALAYCDTPKMFELVYPFITLMVPGLAEGMAEKHHFDVSLFPSALSIGRHLKPGVTTIQRGKHGIELTAHYSVPGMGGVAPIIVCFGGGISLLPSFSVSPVHRTQELHYESDPAKPPAAAPAPSAAPAPPKPPPAKR